MPGKMWDEITYPTLYNGCNYLSMLGLKLNDASKRGHRCFTRTLEYIDISSVMTSVTLCQSVDWPTCSEVPCERYIGKTRIDHYKYTLLCHIKTPNLNHIRMPGIHNCVQIHNITGYMQDKRTPVPSAEILQLPVTSQHQEMVGNYIS